jgi:hypothetical protein
MSDHIKISIDVPESMIAKYLPLLCQLCANTGQLAHIDINFNRSQDKKEEVMNQEEIDDIIDAVKNVEKPPAPSVLDPATFDDIIKNMGLNEEGQEKARRLKQDFVDGKPLNVPELLAFV